MVTSIKIDIFVLVTTRPIAHFGGFVCIPNCVGEFDTDTWQPYKYSIETKQCLSISNFMSSVM